MAFQKLPAMLQPLNNWSIIFYSTKNFSNISGEGEEGPMPQDLILNVNPFMGTIFGSAMPLWFIS